jgi:hypothetical protein
MAHRVVSTVRHPVRALLRPFFFPARTLSQSVLLRHKNEERREEEKGKSPRRERLTTVPNAITFTRLALTPVIGHHIVIGAYSESLWMLMAAGASDWVRARLKEESTGRITVFIGPSPLSLSIPN